jgi:pimeloyl-ACP methyl ester carboxylesterase
MTATARGWKTIGDGLLDAGYRVLVPDLRGSGQTGFLRDSEVRDGTAPALAQDVLDLADTLQLDRFALVGHDWGARTAYTLATVASMRLTCITALALGHQPGSRFSLGPFALALPFWYQWLMYVGAGVDAIAADPIGFARIQWDTWSPPGWFDDHRIRHHSPVPGGNVLPVILVLAAESPAQGRFLVPVDF